MEATMKFCQSCGMPMNTPDAKYGREADGTPSHDYCSYCYDDGKFAQDMTMEQMAAVCAPFVKDHFGGEEAARKAMLELFPKLKRWEK